LNSRREFFRPRSFIFQARFRRLDHGMSRNVIVINDIKRTMNPVSKFMPVTSPYAVRVGTVDDLNQIAGIRASSFFTEGEVSEDSYVYKQWKQEFLDVTSERIKSSKILILVAQDPSPTVGNKDMIVGTADVELLPRRRGVFWDPEELPFRAYISNMSVLLSHRRKGVGKALLRGCEHLALEKGTEHLFLHVMEDNTGARIAYEKCGFVVDKVEDSIKKLLNSPSRIRMYKVAQV